MSSILVQIFIVVAWILLIAIILIYSFRHFSITLKTIAISIRGLFKGFRQKMWMTVGIGSIFALLYLGIVLLGSYLIDPKTRLNVFYLLYKHPIDFIYLGLLVFASITLCIYFTRMLIIYLCNKR